MDTGLQETKPQKRVGRFPASLSSLDAWSRSFSVRKQYIMTGRGVFFSNAQVNSIEDGKANKETEKDGQRNREKNTNDQHYLIANTKDTKEKEATRPFSSINIGVNSLNIIVTSYVQHNIKRIMYKTK